MVLHSMVPWLRSDEVAGNDDRDSLYSLQRNVNGLFDAFWKGWEPITNHRALAQFTPQLSVHDHDSELLIEVELPGMDAEDITVNAEDDVLTISGEKRNVASEDSDSGTYSERVYGRFVRRIPLPDGVDPDHIEAESRNGVLRIHVPKPIDSTKGPKQIAVKTG